MKKLRAEQAISKLLIKRTIKEKPNIEYIVHLRDYARANKN